MWHILKIDYSSDGADKRSMMRGYNGLENAKEMFARLEIAYQLNARVRVKGGMSIQVLGVQIHESFIDHLPDAMKAVEAGHTTLMYETQGLDLDLPE